MQSEEPTAGAGHDCGHRVTELERALAEAHCREAATAEVLRIISVSRPDPQPVFDAIAQNALRVCDDGTWSSVYRFDGRLIGGVAQYNRTAKGVTALRRPYSTPPGRETQVHAAILERRVIHVTDLETANGSHQAPTLAQSLGHRSILVVPILRDGEPLGAIAVAGVKVRPFSDGQINLLQTFADQAAIAIENTRLFEAERARTRELGNALEQQTATVEVLKVISSSPGVLQPVFQTLAERAVRLCAAEHAFVYRFDGRLLRVAVAHNASPELKVFAEKNPITPGRHSGAARAALERRTIHIHDVRVDPEYTFGARELSLRTLLAVPMQKADELLGVILIYRNEVLPFNERQIALMEAFADQAVIAIENTRLFEEVQARNRDLSVALEQQTATSEVLSVISRSKFELQPVLDTIARGAARLCGGVMGCVFRYDGTLMDVGAMIDFATGGEQTWRGLYPRPPTTDTATGRAILENSVVIVADVEADTRADWAHEVARTGGYRGAMAVPMLRGGVPIGAIMVARSEPGPFPETYVDLLQTFADQAVIAIENTRLFEEVQARNSELRIALEQQMATSRILSAISNSPTDIQPVFDAIVTSAAQLCDATFSAVAQFHGGLLHLVAVNKMSPEETTAYRTLFPRQPNRSYIIGRAFVDGRPVHVADVETDPDYDRRTLAVLSAAAPYRTYLGIPILRSGVPIGVIACGRREVRPFTDAQIALVKTFADQAVIAFENAQLFEEVQARNRDLTALSEVGRAVSSTLDLERVLKTIVDRAVELSATDGGSIFYYRYEKRRFELGETTGFDEEVIAKYRKLDIAAGETGLGEAIATRQPLQIPDVTKRASNPLRDAALELGLHAALIVPLLSSEGSLGALVLQRRQPGEFPSAVVSLMQSFADQSAIALENARLFEEIARKSRELEITSQHKSQFVANMSHELRTPLAAILGYAELIQEGFYGELPERSMAALARIRTNGKHLLGLINTVLDIAKIESGQFKLNLGEYALESVVETVRAATESLAETKKLALRTAVAKALPIGVGDEQRLTQVLLNLIGNAIKFTDAGEVRIAAGAGNGHFTVSVSDTGPGIPAEERERIFEKFRQVDGSNTRAKGGTGLGLAIAREIVEMHGGRIWVESTLGEGSTFRLELPVRATGAA